jgi:hypothetical protein
MDLASATADRREKGDFIARTERRVPCSEFLVPRRDQRATIAGEFGRTRTKLCKEILDARTRCQLDGFLRTAGNFFEAAEEEYLYANRRVYTGGRHTTHRRIVTRAAPRG